MNELTKRAVAALVTLLIGAIMAWIAGYNFDHRSEDVAVGAGVILTFALIAASYPFRESK